MLGAPWKRSVFAAFLGAAALGAQEPTELAERRFEVVSIRPVPSNAPLIIREQTFTPVLPGCQYVDSRTSLFWMIIFAYDAKNPAIQLAGLPDWAKSQSYAVAAKAAQNSVALPPAENQQQVRLMLRAMLADRFHLKLHTEMRQKSILSLDIAKGGFKLNEVAPPVPPEKEGFVNAAVGDSGGRIIGKKSTMEGMAKMLVIFLKEPAIDQTGLKGYYDFDVKWSAPESADGQPPAKTFGAAGSGLLISTLQDQFGLRLRKSTGLVKYWVIDHVEPPTEN